MKQVIVGILLILALYALWRGGKQDQQGCQLPLCSACVQYGLHPVCPKEDR